MIVYATLNDDSTELFKGSIDECLRYCERELIEPSRWDSVNILKDSGEIVKRVIKYGKRLEKKTVQR